MEGLDVFPEALIANVHLTDRDALPFARGLAPFANVRGSKNAKLDIASVHNLKGTPALTGNVDVCPTPTRIGPTDRWIVGPSDRPLARPTDRSTARPTNPPSVRSLDRPTVPLSDRQQKSQFSLNEGCQDP